MSIEARGTNPRKQHSSPLISHTPTTFAAATTRSSNSNSSSQEQARMKMETLAWKLLSFVILLLPFSFITADGSEHDKSLLVVTVATDNTDGFQRFMRSAKLYGLKVQVLGMGVAWEGGDVARYAGGGHKVNLLLEAMEEHRDDKNLIVMFVDSYDVVFTEGAGEVLQNFDKLGARIVFSAEDFCWPDASLADKYPAVKMNEKRYLNSGGFIGYASDIYKMLKTNQINNEDDDQLFYTKIFLDPYHKENLALKLDGRGEIFQNLNGALEDVRLKFKGSNSFLYNMKTGTTPVVVHGNGPIKTQFNGLTNYLADQWTPTAGCLGCTEDTISLQGVKPEDFPTVMIALFLSTPMPFVEEFLELIGAQDYPKDKITLFLHYANDFHYNDVQGFMDSHGMKYHMAHVYGPGQGLNEWDAHNKAVDMFTETECRYMFVVESYVQLENNHTLQLLIERNRSVIAPMLLRPGKLWSNFWGAISSNGYYKRSDDYVDLLNNQRRGLWNVPYITGAYLVHAHRVAALKDAYIHEDLDPDMALAHNLREQGVFMYVDNQEYYGHLVNPDDFNTTHLHNDMYEIINNKYTWEKKYIHPDYRASLEADSKFVEPCPDVFWVPIVKPIFCRHLIEEMENFGRWSGGGDQASKDERLNGGYENVPTVDIHTNQINWETEWLTFLRDYVAPINAKAFGGYYTEGRAVMNFVVRYKPNEQNHLKPHSDSSTYTINIALNEPGKEYEGGGTRFLRYDCSVTKSRVGWLLMHPGRLTHHHEGLPTTKGTRYIMVSFIDP